MKKHLGAFLLFLVALIFGLCYVFQAKAAEFIGPFEINAFRYLISALCVFPFIFKKDDTDTKKLIKISFLVGLTITIAGMAQIMAAGKISSGKIGFITSLYIVEVPIINYFLSKNKINTKTKLAIILAFLGLFLLTDISDFSFSPYDFVALIASISYAFEIVLIGKYANDLPVAKLCFGEFLTAGLISLVGTLLFESIEISAYRNCLIPMLYLAFVSGVLGFFLQIKGQALVDDETASLIMSLESVISVLAGFLFLHELLTIKELIGCLLMFIGVIICVKSQNKQG